MLDSLFLRRMARLCPATSREIELCPVRRQYFLFTPSSHQQQAQAVGGILFRVAVQSFEELVHLLD